MMTLACQQSLNFVLVIWMYVLNARRSSNITELRTENVTDVVHTGVDIKYIR